VTGTTGTTGGGVVVKETDPSDTIFVVVLGLDTDTGKFILFFCWIDRIKIKSFFFQDGDICILIYFDIF